MSRGTITRRGKSSYRLKFDVPSADGKRTTRYVTVRGKRQDAEKELTRLLQQVDDGRFVDPSKVTLGEYMSAWLDNERDLSPKTAERYRELLDQQIVPHLGTVPLQRLRPSQVADWHTALLKGGGRKGRPLSARTVGHAHRLLHRALKRAVDLEDLVRNPLSTVSPPKVTGREIEILTAEQIALVRVRLHGHQLYPLVMLALGTGLRRGELLGLQLADIDLEAGTLRVERSLEETKAGLRVKPPKTAKGRRNMKLPASVVDILREHRRSLLETRMALGMGRPATDALLFAELDGSPRSPANLTQAWRWACTSLELPRVSFHALRHTHASALIAAGLDVVTVSKRLGHANPTVTLTIYAHLFDNTDAAAAEAIDAAMRTSGQP